MLPLRRPLAAALALAAAACAAAPACLLDSSPIASGGAATTGTDTTAGGAAGSVAGGTAGGSAGGTGGAGGAGGGPTVNGDACPGTAIQISPYSPLQLAGIDTALATDGGEGTCGGDGSPDVVYQVTPAAGGRLTATLDAVSPFEGIVYARLTCDAPGSEKGCDAGAVTLPVKAGAPVFVIVDGEGSKPTGKFSLSLSLDGCGNGVLEGPEQCDDGDGESGDGCSDACAVECECPPDTDCDTFLVGTRCYALVRSPGKTWDQASIACQSWGGSLAVLATEGEIDAVEPSLDSDSGAMWIGATDLVAEGNFAWQNGEPWVYQNGKLPWEDHFFPPNEPNGGTGENCVEIYENGRLNDESCAQVHDYLCERAPAGAPPANAP